MKTYFILLVIFKMASGHLEVSDGSDPVTMVRTTKFQVKQSSSSSNYGYGFDWKSDDQSGKGVGSYWLDDGIQVKQGDITNETLEEARRRLKQLLGGFFEKQAKFLERRMKGLFQKFKNDQDENESDY